MKVVSCPHFCSEGSILIIQRLWDLGSVLSIHGVDINLKDFAELICSIHVLIRVDWYTVLTRSMNIVKAMKFLNLNP